MRFLFIFSFVFGTLFLLLYLIRMSQGLPILPAFGIAALTSAAVAAYIHRTSDRIGTIAAKLVFGRHDATSRSERRLYAQLKEAEKQKRQLKFAEADRILNEILVQAPGFPEALALKAKIAWEAYKDAETAKASLTQLMAAADPKTSQYKWASRLYDEILGLEKLKG